MTPEELLIHLTNPKVPLVWLAACPVGSSAATHPLLFSIAIGLCALIALIIYTGYAFAVLELDSWENLQGGAQTLGVSHQRALRVCCMGHAVVKTGTSIATGEQSFSRLHSLEGGCSNNKPFPERKPDRLHACIIEYPMKH